MRQDVRRQFPHQPALVIAWEHGERRARLFVALRVALRHAHEEERQRLQQLLLRQHFPVQKLDRVFVGSRRRVPQPHVVPAEVLHPSRIGGGHHVAGVGGEIEERMLEDAVLVVAGGELRHGVMHILIRFVLYLQRHDGQAVEEKHEINFLLRLARLDRAEVEVRPERDPVLRVFLRTGALGGTRLRVEQPELQPAHRQAVPENHPERRALQFLPQRPEYFVSRIRAVILGQLVERVGLRGLQERPEVLLGDEMRGIGDVGLFEDAIAVLADEVSRDVLLKGQLRSFLARHGRCSPFLVAAELLESASRTVAPQDGQRKRSRDSSSNRNPVSSSSDSGRQVKSPPPAAATFSISPQDGHSNSSRSLANSPSAFAFACRAAISVASARIFAKFRFMAWLAGISPGRARTTPRRDCLAQVTRLQAPPAPGRARLWLRVATWPTSGLRRMATRAG